MDKLMELYNMEEAPILVMIQSGEHISATNKSDR